eukprot:CAMPEP_0184985530 /NCGR_PEP_ID=MMETSP1098-20130426/14159_1 /TAXON_ID=89044 /ORGANISM="Spumella elongata, Strain CCAP 955/1" /LENGTH=846 /DNA_ID=CAMNT_0027509619 /DNA_START=67 /DNA_END=2607 /DNA_ORIENTATION=-
MAFKKSKGKTGKKKPKKSGGKKDSWSHEGGMVLDGKDEENNEDGAKRKRRSSTQDREESIRRSKLKNNDRKRKKDFKVKMSKKVKFGDVVAAAKQEESDDEESETEEVQPKFEVRLNPLSVMDRLKVFVAKSLDQREAQSGDEESEEEAGDASGSEIDEEEEYEEGSEEEEYEEEGEEALVGDNVAEQDVQDQDLDSSDELETKRDSSTADYYFDAQFNAPQDATKQAPSKMRQLEKIENTPFDIYGQLNFEPEDEEEAAESALPIAPGPYSSIAQMPGLHKLFRGPAACERIDPRAIDEVNSHLLPYLASYADTFVEGREASNDTNLLNGMLLHTVSHTVKARAKVIKHNQKLQRKLRDSIVANAVAKETTTAKAAKKNKASKGDAALPIPTPVVDSVDAIATEDADAMRDQGFCRPRVLILCPFRGTALRVVQQIRAILGENTSVSGWDKLQDEYGQLEEDDEEGTGPDAKKPQDWKDLFTKQNIDDDFKMGIQLNPGHGKGSGPAKGVYMRLFSDFFISDIILASPLGLRLAMGNAPKTGDKVKDNANKGKNNDLSPDFLSSVEVVMLHQADVMYMQNWDHLDFIMKYTNKLPTAAHDTDFSRVRQYFLEGQAAKHRQLMVTSHFNQPELQMFFREHAQSAAGSIRVKKHWGKGELVHVVDEVKQVFQLVPGVKSFDTQEDARFKYFKDSVLAPLLRLEQKHTLIVTPSYFSYVRVRNELMKQDANAAYVCEYSRDSEISRGRSRFFHGKNDLLLYSGRCHFFRRFPIRGAKHIVFYSLPEYAHFYSEWVNMLSSHTPDGGDDGKVSCLVLFTAFERMALERIVGPKKCAQMLSASKTTFVYC